MKAAIVIYGPVCRSRMARRFNAAQGFAAIDETDSSENEEREPDMLYLWQAAGTGG